MEIVRANAGRLFPERGRSLARSASPLQHAWKMSHATVPPRAASEGPLALRQIDSPDLNLMPFGNSFEESQRDSGSKPKVARNELPWVIVANPINPNGVAAAVSLDATPLGLMICVRPTQGSSFLATLGWRTHSRWDCTGYSLPRILRRFISERH